MTFVKKLRKIHRLYEQINMCGKIPALLLKFISHNVGVDNTGLSNNLHYLRIEFRVQLRVYRNYRSMLVKILFTKIPQNYSWNTMDATLVVDE